MPESKTCGECGGRQAVAIDGCFHCTKCESDLFPAGGTVHKLNILKSNSKVQEQPQPIEEDDGEEEN